MKNYNHKNRSKRRQQARRRNKKRKIVYNRTEENKDESINQSLHTYNV